MMHHPHEQKNPRLGLLILVLGALIFWGSCSLLMGCKKKGADQGSELHTVTYTLYSHAPKFVFSHVEDLMLPGHVDTIIGNTYAVTLQVRENVFTNEQALQSVIQCSSDSMHIKAEYDGKKVERGFRSTAGLFSISINLASAK